MAQQYRISKRNNRSASSKKSGWSKLTFLLSLILIAAIVLAVLELTNTTHLFHKGKPATEVITKAGNPSPVPSSNVSASNPTPKKNSSTGSSGNVIQGGATDTQGQSSATTSPSQWITSKSGNITVEQPVANSLLQNGDSLIGTANVSSINYRLIDDDIGVVATGSLSVINGKFSGVLHFGHKASTGRLDVFSSGANGIELNEIQIAVRFQ